MTTVKIAISLPYETLERVRKGVRDKVASSVSAYIAKAIEEKASAADLDALLDRMLDETGGPMTETESVDARRELGLAPVAPVVAKKIRRGSRAR